MKGPKIMKKLLLTVAFAGLALPAVAQTEFATGANITGASTINDRIDDIYDDVQDDFDRSNDLYRHGFIRNDGTAGSVSLSYNGRSGNSDGQDLSVGGRVHHSAGKFSQNAGLVIDYAEDDDGDADRKDVSVIYDGTYDFSPRVYGFVLGRATVDGMVSNDLADFNAGTLDADTAGELDGRVKRDAFLGVGPGYRVIDTPDTTWRVQAGVGLRYVQSVDLSQADQLDSSTDTGYIVSSRIWHQFNDKVFVTNDTDYLESDANKTAFNELGLNYKFTDSLIGRASYQTEYVSDRKERTDNKLGLAVGFQF